MMSKHYQWELEKVQHIVFKNRLKDVLDLYMLFYNIIKEKLF